jgi:hypothetical protein
MSANMTKTIEYAWQSFTGTIESTSAADISATADLSAITVYIPETTDREFKSVFLQWGFRDNGTVAATINLPVTIMINIDDGEYSVFTYNGTALVQTGENQSPIFQNDITSFFTNNFSSTSHDIGCKSTILTTPNCSISNIWCKLFITYLYDDTAHSKKIKTVKIPIESKQTLLTTTLTAIGINQIPALDSFLPEADKIYRQIFFEIRSNFGTSSTNDNQLEIQIGSDYVTQFGLHEGTLNTATFETYIDIRNSMSTSASQDFCARATSFNAWDTVGALLYVTYEYDHDLSTSIMNSIEFIIVDEPGWIETNTDQNAGYYKREFYIQEPENIEIKQSAIIFTGSSAVPATVYIKIGEQHAYTAYTWTCAGQMVGPGYLIKRFDQDGITLKRGRNELSVYAYQAAVAVCNFNGKVILNYTSSKHEYGDRVHNHTIKKLINDLSSAINVVTLSDIKIFDISRDYYWLLDLGFELVNINSGAVGAYGYQVKINPGELNGFGWSQILTSFIIGDSEIAPQFAYCKATDIFKKYQQYPHKNMLDAEEIRNFRYYATAATRWSSISIVTYHSITSAVTGFVYSYTGDGSGINVEIWNNSWLDIPIKVLDTTTTTGGYFSTYWYNDCDNLFAMARQGATLAGRSATGTAG